MKLSRPVQLLVLALGALAFSAMVFFTGFMTGKRTVQPELETKTTALQECRSRANKCAGTYYDSYVLGVVEGCTWAMEDPYNLGLCQEVLKAHAEAQAAGSL